MSEEVFKPCRIRWRDHNAINGWQRREDVAPMVITVDSIGWLIDENDHAVLLAQSVTGESVNECLSILKECIVDRWEF